MTQTVERLQDALPASATSRPGRLYELDLLRFVAAAAVVVFHLGFIGSEATGPQPSALLAPVAKYGYLGVDFFFMLSGFVIAISMRGRDAAAFAKARLARLMPAYVVAIGLTSAVLALAGDAPTLGRVLGNLSFTQRLFSQPFIDGAYWSLLIEMNFYAMVALLIATRQSANLERFAYAWLIVAVVVLPSVEVPGWVATLLIRPYAHLFVAGILLSKISADRKPSLPRLAALSICLLASITHATAHAEFITNDTRQYSPAVAAAVTSVLFALMCWVAIKGIPALRRPSFATLGAASYPLYLLHQEIGYRIYDAWRGPFWVMFPTLLLAFCAISHMVAAYIEAPANAWFRRRN